MRSDMLTAREGAGAPAAGRAPHADGVHGIVRSPSWPPMTIDVSDEMTRVARPKAVRKAIVVATIIFANNLAIFCLSCFMLREYLQIDTLEAFGPGLAVQGHLMSDSLEVSVSEPQNAIFRSQSANSALSVRAATGSEAMVVLAKSSGSSWEMTNSPTDEFLLRKGAEEYLKVDGSTKTTTISTHLDLKENTVYGAPLVLSTGAPITTQQCTATSQCGAGQCLSSGSCGSGVVAADILLAPGSSGSVRFNGPLEPVSGDLVLKPEERIIVRKQVLPDSSSKTQPHCQLTAMHYWESPQ